MSTKLFDAMVRLAGCITTELEEIEIENCRVLVTAAEQIDLSADMSDGDTAWVALGGIEPVVTLQEGQSTRCNTLYRYTLAVGHVSCYPITEHPTTTEEMLATTDKQTQAMEALLRGITCCSWVPVNRVFDVTEWIPFYEGGVVGGQWTVVLE